MKKVRIMLDFDNRENLERISLREDVTELEKIVCKKCYESFDKAYNSFLNNIEGEDEEGPETFGSNRFVEFTDDEYECLRNIVNKYNLSEQLGLYF